VGSEARIPARHADEDRVTGLGRLVRRLALAGVVMMALLACVSAYLRLSAAGIGCVPWPACYQQPAAAERQHHPVARLAHRVLASTLGVVVVMIVLTSVSVRPRRPVVMGTAFAALALTLLLAGLGRVTSTASAPGVALANLLGGMALAALLWWLALHAGRDSARAPSQSRWPASVVLGLVLIQLVLGAFISTTHTAPACPVLPLCMPAASELPAALHVSHRILAIALLAAAGVLAATLIRRGAHAARSALALAGLLLVQTASGTLMVALDFPLWLALAHNAGALLALLAAVWVLAG
jgi:cytochrome c oxidase assembly protein subunit 15